MTPQCSQVGVRTAVMSECDWVRAPLALPETRIQVWDRMAAGTPMNHIVEREGIVAMKLPIFGAARGVSLALSPLEANME